MKSIATLLILLGLPSCSFATWSIILVDEKTGEIGIAGASCSYNCYGIGRILPGQGAVIVQAMSNHDARQAGVKRLKAGQSPAQIVAALRDPRFRPEEQQYAVVSVRFLDAPATYTGTATHAHQGALTARGVSVQGNTLTSDDELQTIMDAVLKGRRNALPIDEILMLALEAGSNAGGDRRCGAQRATSAFITVTKADDTSQKPFLDLSIFGQKSGGMNAVSMLRSKYTKWKSRASE
ncbi:DUF1028 domain-containing protein [Larkinella insperata]|uniref:DUF1028 domain-containing protein n=1 Tax=Larkinella insperata TaxID=332158 RepID=A0ABW3QNV2_9BACT|nr:DUF1028 domain-containing protein [Larkinella insperata]